MLLISRGGGPKLSPGKGGRAGGSGPGAVARCWVGPAAEQGGRAACSLSGLQRRGACGYTRRRRRAEGLSPPLSGVIEGTRVPPRTTLCQGSRPQRTGVAGHVPQRGAPCSLAGRWPLPGWA